MKTRFRNEADNWSADGSKITEPAKLDAVRRTLIEEGPIIVEHWFYHGASAPERLIFENFEEFTSWLDADTYAGDAIDVWSWAATCQPERRLTEGSAQMTRAWFRKAEPIRTVHMKPANPPPER